MGTGHDREKRFVGVDVGGTKILGVGAHSNEVDNGALRDDSYLAANSVQIPTPNGDGHTLVRAILGVVEMLNERGTATGANTERASGDVATRRSGLDAISGIGVGVPGLVDRCGVLRFGPHLPGIVGFGVTEALESHFGGEVRVDNDATNAALAEHLLGAASGHENAIVVTQGTGIGGGLIVNNQVVRGANGFAGEPGHWLADPSGFTCACGMTGCWETVSSGAGLRNFAQVAAKNGKARLILEFAGGVVEDIEGVHVGEAAAAGDGEAILIFSALAKWTASGLGGLVSILDPSVIVLGGGLTASAEFYMDEVAARLASNTMGGEHRPLVQVVPAALGPAAGAIGGLINVSGAASNR